MEVIVISFEMFLDGKPIGRCSDFTFDRTKIDDLKEESKINFNNREVTLTLENSKFDRIAMYQLFGYQIIENNYLIDRVRVRTHKKKRINKKWTKRYGYKGVPKKDVYIMGDKIIGHPDTINKMRKCL